MSRYDDHYSRLTIQPAQYTMVNGLPYWAGQVVKYVSRAGHKVEEGLTVMQAELKDLRKAKRNIEFRINQLERGDPLSDDDGYPKAIPRSRMKQLKLL